MGKNKEKKFGTTVMYYFTFDTSLRNKKLLDELIEKFDGIYKLIFDVIINNFKHKIDYDQLSGKKIINNNDTIIEKLYVLKRLENKSNMVYYDLNTYMIDFIEKNKTNNINIILYAKKQQQDEYDTNLNNLILFKLVPNEISLKNILFNINQVNNMIISNEVVNNVEIYKSVQIIGNTLYVKYGISYLKTLIDNLISNVEILDDVKKMCIESYDKILKEQINEIEVMYNIEYSFF